MASQSQKYGYEDERLQIAVNPSFHCPICFNVLKEPKMCRSNEHVFCSACITQHLTNSSTCPECMEELTVETLRRAPRVLVNCLSELTINCDYFSRGCREIVRLEELQAHVFSCGFSPVACSNDECGMEMNKRDRILHEMEKCEFRRVKCHDCGEMKKEIEGMKCNQKEQLNQVEEMKEQLNQLPEMKQQLNQLPEMKQQLNQLPEMKQQLNQVPEMKDQLVEMKDQLNQLPEIKQQLNQLPEMKQQLNQVPEMKDQLVEMKDQLTEIKAELVELSSLKEDIKEVRAVMGEILHKLKNPEHNIEFPLHDNTTKQDIVIVGGRTKATGATSSVETFSWNKRTWAPLPPTKVPRSETSSIVHENQVFVAGGWTGKGRTDTMEVLKIDEQHLKWTESPAKLPYTCNAHKTVVYQNSLIHIGGYNGNDGELSDAISKVCLTSPYSAEQLCRIPQPRFHHGVEICNDKVLILGGRTSFSSEDVVDSVFEFDVNKNECKQMPPLPHAVSNMATVRWGDKVVVIGGEDKKGKVLSDVLMYDCKTGESNVLPSMRHKRSGCTAIITGNAIVVMGGWDKKNNSLSTVECFTLGGDTWEDLPPMIEPRRYATAVVIPSMI